MKMFFALFLSCATSCAIGADAQYRGYVTSASMMSYTGQLSPTPFWISSFTAESKPQYFTNSSGASIIANPQTVVSAYDSTASRYDVSNFYALKSDRHKLISHIHGFNQGELFSIGYDTGINSQKLTMNNSFFAGYTKTFSFTKMSLTSFSFGSWFGGSINESPCIDSYGRQYSCQSLTAWTDYKPNYPRPLSFLDVKHVWVFD